MNPYQNSPCLNRSQKSISSSCEKQLKVLYISLLSFCLYCTCFIFYACICTLTLVMLQLCVQAIEMEIHGEQGGESRDWSNLPADILEKFCQKLGSIPNQIRFGGVCKSWLSVANNYKSSKVCVPSTPWIISNDDTSAHFRLLSNSDNKMFKMYKPFKPLRGTFIVGSFKGWLIMRSETDHKNKLFILNLLSRY